MKNERILIADDERSFLEKVSEGIKFFEEESGHIVIGKAGSVKEVETLMGDGLRPTVALVDHQFPREGDGQRAAAIIREFSPETKIISYSSDSGLKWGDDNWYKGMHLEELIDALTNLQH